MSTILCPGLLTRGSEFVVVRDPISNTTVRRWGTCGPDALATVLTNSLNRSISCAAVYSAMRGHSPALCDASGASTLSALAAAATRL